MANDEQRDYWTGDVGRSWVEHQEALDRTLTSVSERLIELLAPRPGETIFDIGCGAGETTLRIAKRVGLSGRAIGVDISPTLLARARERAAAAESRAQFVEADAEAESFHAANADAVASRFGIMFFADPVRAFTNLRSALKPGGRLVVSCWREPHLNEWVTVPMGALQTLVPTVPADPHAPGPFAFANKARVTAILEAAGFGRIAIEPFEFTMKVGEGADPVGAAVQFYLQIGPAARAIREAHGDVQAAAPGLLAAALSKHIHDGVVRLGATTWMVTAS